MKRREFITLLGGSVIPWPLAADAQPATTIARIGWLVSGSPTSYRSSLTAFQEGLEALGYKEGRDLAIEYRWADGNVGRLPGLAAELVERKVDIILAGGTLGAQAAKNATSEIPIVTAGAGDLVESGLVSNLSRPGGNLTGFINSTSEAAGKRLEIVKEIDPRAKDIAVLWNPTNRFTRLEWKVVQEARSILQLNVASYEAHTVEGLESALGAISKTHSDFLSVLNDPFLFANRKEICDAAAQIKLPAIYGFREFVDDGGMISYGTNLPDSYRRAATYVDKILKGAKPGDLPVQAPTKFELLVNSRTAKALGLTFPPSLLARADEVIE
jgi:putative ABC transport system substrate-binding protein